MVGSKTLIHLYYIPWLSTTRRERNLENYSDKDGKRDSSHRQSKYSETRAKLKLLKRILPVKGTILLFLYFPRTFSFLLFVFPRIFNSDLGIILPSLVFDTVGSRAIVLATVFRINRATFARETMKRKRRRKEKRAKGEKSLGKVSCMRGHEARYVLVMHLISGQWCILYYRSPLPLWPLSYYLSRPSFPFT